MSYEEPIGPEALAEKITKIIQASVREPDDVEGLHAANLHCDLDLAFMEELLALGYGDAVNIFGGRRR